MNPYLEFVEPKDYIAHLLQHTTGDGLETWLEISSMRGELGEFGIIGVTFYAVATARLDDHIATCSLPLLHTTNFDLDFDKHRPEEQRERTRLHRNFDKVRAYFEDQGLRVQRGKWMWETPPRLTGGKW